MLKHTICHMELASSNLGRTVEFYETLFGWSFAAVGEDHALFRTPDGLEGAFRLARRSDVESGPGRPVLQVEVEGYLPYVTGAMRLQGGYATYRGAGDSDWTIEVRDPDGNALRLVKAKPVPPMLDGFAAVPLPSGRMSTPALLRDAEAPEASAPLPETPMPFPDLTEIVAVPRSAARKSQKNGR